MLFNWQHVTKKSFSLLNVTHFWNGNFNAKKKEWLCIKLNKTAVWLIDWFKEDHDLRKLGTKFVPKNFHVEEKDEK